MHTNFNLSRMLKPAFKTVTCLALLTALFYLAMAPSANAKDNIQNKHAANQSIAPPIELTEEEINWIASHKPIRVAIKHNWKPIEFISEGNQFQGLSIDYLHALESEVGLKFEKLDIDDGYTYESIDMLSSIAAPDALEGSGYEAINPLFKFRYAIYTHKKNNNIHNMEDLHGKRVAVYKHGQLVKLLEKKFPTLKLRRVAIAEEAFNAINHKNIDAYIGNEIVVDYEASIQGADYIKKVGYAPSTANITMAVRSDWPILKSILNKSIETLVPEQRRILNTWDLSSDNDDSNETLIFILLSMALLAVSIMIFKGYQLKKTIKMQELEAANLVWHQANFDFLTNLPNRLMFNKQLVDEVNRSSRSNQPFALLFIDLDYFKQVNDEHGHAVGDQLLIEVANRITKSVRATDSVARLGGDEFTVILSNIDNTNTIKITAKKILTSLDVPFDVNGITVHITSSIGITTYPNDTKSIQALIKNADQAMYEAKKQGRNRLQFFTKSMHESAVHRVDISNGLRKAVIAKEFKLDYQAIIDLKTKKIAKAEALIRWNHPKKGIINPDDFIQIAEETDVIHWLGHWVFKQGLEDLALLQEAIHPDFQISINVSPKQFGSKSQLSKWPNMLKKSGISPRSLAIEITEGTVLESNASTSKLLKKLHAANIQISIDDFGTGYSSISYLKKFDIDILKLDRSFVHNLESDNDSKILCHSIIDMAHKLGLKVIAEGIENAKQMELLLEYGCDYGQGYLFSKPQSLEKLIKSAQKDKAVTL